MNNVLPALCDASFKQVYKDRFLRPLAVHLMREGMAVAERAGIRLESIPGTSLPLVTLLATLPAALASAVVARKTIGIETHGSLKGSTWQSVARGRSTEIEYLNGEIVRMGKELHVPTPLNELVVTLMQRVTAERRYLSTREIEEACRQRGGSNAPSMRGDRSAGA